MPVANSERSRRAIGSMFRRVKTRISRAYDRARNPRSFSNFAVCSQSDGWMAPHVRSPLALPLLCVPLTVRHASRGTAFLAFALTQVGAESFVVCLPAFAPDTVTRCPV